MILILYFLASSENCFVHSPGKLSAVYVFLSGILSVVAVSGRQMTSAPFSFASLIYPSAHAIFFSIVCGSSSIKKDAVAMRTLRIKNYLKLFCASRKNFIYFSFGVT